METRIKDCIQEYGLGDLGWDYIHWYYGGKTVCLDGHFTFQELREIADYMEANMDKDEEE